MASSAVLATGRCQEDSARTRHAGVRFEVRPTVERGERVRTTIRARGVPAPSLLRPIGVRIVVDDLEAIQKRALAEGLPYQTLISSLLHKYASGRLKDI